MVDTSILISGIGWPRWPHEVLLAAARNDFRLVLSAVIIDEAREKFRDRFPNHLQAFEEFLGTSDYELAPSPSVEEVANNQDLMHDPFDIPIALSAINAQVAYFISEDKHFTASTEATAKLHDQLQIMLSGTFLRQVMGWTSDELEAVRGRKWSDISDDL